MLPCSLHLLIYFSYFKDNVLTLSNTKIQCTSGNVCTATIFLSVPQFKIHLSSLCNSTTSLCTFLSLVNVHALPFLFPAVSGNHGIMCLITGGGVLVFLENQKREIKMLLIQCHIWITPVPTHKPCSCIFPSAHLRPYTSWAVCKDSFGRA